MVKPADRQQIAESAITTMHEAATSSLPKETGGILLGYRTNDGVSVTGAIEVKDRRATRTAYRRSRRQAMRRLAEALALEPADSAIGYVGEWHSHPAPQPPSDQDLAALAATALAAPDDIVLVVLSRHGGEWRVSHADARRVVRSERRSGATPRRTAGGETRGQARDRASRTSAAPRRRRRNPN